MHEFNYAIVLRTLLYLRYQQNLVRHRLNQMYQGQWKALFRTGHLNGVRRLLSQMFQRQRTDFFRTGETVQSTILAIRSSQANGLQGLSLIIDGQEMK